MKTINKSYSSKTLGKSSFDFKEVKDAVSKMDFSDFQGTLKNINLLLVKSPKNSYLYAQRGGLKYDFGYYRGAVSDLTKALTYSGKVVRVNVLKYRALAKERCGDLFGALGDYSIILEFSENEEAALNSGLIYEFMGDFERSLKFYNMAMSINPENDFTAEIIEDLIQKRKE